MISLKLSSKTDILPPILFISQFHLQNEVLPERINLLPRSEISVLELTDGSWRSNPSKKEGRVIDTLDLFSDTDRDSIRFAVSALESMLNLAAEAQEGPDAMGEVELVATTEGEYDSRSAIVYWGTISIRDSRLSLRTLETGSIRLTLTIERDAEWDLTTKVKKRWNRFPVHGGMEDFPITNPVTEATSSRISQMNISSSYGGYLKRIWMGIKSGRRNLTYFNPQIRVEADYVTLQSGGDMSEVREDIFQGGKGLMCDFNTNAGWKPRFFAPMHKWNDDAANFSGSFSPYIGNYTLLGRLRSDSPTEVYGVRAATRWVGTSEATFLPPFYFKSDRTNGALSYYNFGEINIGGLRWTSPMDFSLYPHRFVVGVHATALDGGEHPLFFDDMFIVPSDRSLHLNLPFEITADTKINYFCNSDGTTRAFISDRNDSDSMEAPIARRIHAEISDITVSNFMVPPEGGRLITVGDRGIDSLKALGSHNRIEMEITRRTGSFVN